MDIPHANSRRRRAPPPEPFSSSSSPSILSLPSSSTSSDALSPRTLYAQSFNRPTTAQSLPPRQSRKNMKKFTGAGASEEEFDSLPLAVRRKYFSTLERLRFAQSSRANAIGDLPVQKSRKTSLADRRGLKTPVIEPFRRPTRRLQKSSRQLSISSTEASWFLTLPEKIRKQQFTREEQVILAGRLRESVILDAADEAIYKASRRASRNLAPMLLPPTPSSAPSSPRCSTSSRREDSASNMAAAMYESFRWMDEESDLDLRLALDDYHANLDGAVLPSPTSNRRPSFRRQMSISKMPFGRNSLSSLRPRNLESPKQENYHKQARQKGRTLSLIQPKHIVNNSVSSIDPNATHYQDPEARLKLRVYLASPQKFDEAIEFGFPSLDGVADGADKENLARHSSREQPSRTRPSKELPEIKSSFATDGGKSFLDDSISLFEDDDDISMPDPDSPLTPADQQSYRPVQNTSISGHGARSTKNSAEHSNSGFARPMPVKAQEGYTQAMAGSREMTLRMTLTRPDLRADESTIYGWQTSKSITKDNSPILSDSIDEKIDLRGPFGGVDGWGPTEKENGVVKRFWNRVRSSQKK